jgi:hypothetical protein
VSITANKVRHMAKGYYTRATTMNIPSKKRSTRSHHKTFFFIAPSPPSQRLAICQQLGGRFAALGSSS